MTMGVACELVNETKYWSAYQLVQMGVAGVCIWLKMCASECGQAWSQVNTAITAALLFVLLYLLADRSIVSSLDSILSGLDLSEWELVSEPLEVFLLNENQHHSRS